MCLHELSVSVSVSVLSSPSSLIGERLVAHLPLRLSCVLLAGVTNLFNHPNMHDVSPCKAGVGVSFRYPALVQQRPELSLARMMYHGARLCVSCRAASRSPLLCARAGLRGCGDLLLSLGGCLPGVLFICAASALEVLACAVTCCAGNCNIEC